MADIKQIRVDNTTYNFKDEAARQQLATKQDAITQVTASADTNVGTPSVTPTWNNGTLNFAFHNVKGETGATGATGPQGDSVLVGQGDLPLAHVLGDDNTKAMSQKGVTDAFESQHKDTMDNSDLDIIDEEGYSIVRFEGGHIKTKNFNSATDIPTNITEVKETSESSDLDIIDENDYSIVQFKDGHIKTKFFDSRTAGNNLDTASKSLVATKASFTTGQSMSFDSPDVKNHYLLSFTASVDTMGTLSILVGSANVYSKGRVDVSSTSITTYGNNTWAQHTYQHGLTIEDNITIIIKTSRLQYAELTIMTGNGESVYTKEIPWNGCSSGCSVSNDGGTYEDCTFMADYYGLLKDVWVFGDSYLFRWANPLNELGFDGFMLDGFSGRQSSQAVTSFMMDVLIGTPKVVVWMMGMNDIDSSAVNISWKTAFDTIKAYCIQHNIEMICCTIPNVPNRDHTYKNDYILESGVRVVDIAEALGATEANSTWYPGLLGADNVHPTTSGAMRIALTLAKEIGLLLTK